MFSFLFDKYLDVELIDKEDVCLTFFITCKMFPRGCSILYTQQEYEIFDWSISFPIFALVTLFHFRHSSECVLHLTVMTQ